MSVQKRTFLILCQSRNPARLARHWFLRSRDPAADYLADCAGADAGMYGTGHSRKCLASSKAENERQGRGTLCTKGQTCFPGVIRMIARSQQWSRMADKSLVE
jgi:hypothetical protein